MAVRGQYAHGVVGGVEVPGYTEEVGVPAESHTETYAALRLEVGSWRWAGVPFYLRTGKRLARKVTEIAVALRPVPHLGFGREGSLGARPNMLVMTLQPGEGVALELAARIPGARMRLTPVHMEYLYGTSFASQSADAYERLILDAIQGDASLFMRSDEIERAWEIMDPIIAATEKQGGIPPQAYAVGSQGPECANALFPGTEKGWQPIH